MYNGKITIFAGCSPLSFTCQGFKIFPAGENEAMNGACRSFPLKPIFCFWLSGMCKNQFELLSGGRVQEKAKVEVMNTSEQVLLNKSIPCFFSFAVMDYAPRASGVPATLFVAAGNTMRRLASGKWQRCEM